MDKTLIPILLEADGLLAKAFESYGRLPAQPDLQAQIARLGGEARLILLGCTEAAALLASETAQAAGLTALHPEARLQHRLAIKREFYALCEEFGIPPAESAVRGDCPGNTRVFTAFLDAGARVRALSCGHGLLAAPYADAAIISEPAAGLPPAKNLIRMLESLGCTGFINVSLGLCRGEYVAQRADFDLRRSCAQFRAAGLDMARLSVETYFDPGSDVQTAKKACFWHRLPKGWIYRHAENPDLRCWARELARQGRSRRETVRYRPENRAAKAAGR